VLFYFNGDQRNLDAKGRKYHCYRDLVEWPTIMGGVGGGFLKREGKKKLSLETMELWFFCVGVINIREKKL
jgi:hypothetical protein